MSEISSWICEWSQRRPQGIAIRFEGQEIDHATMERRTARLAGALAHRVRICEGDRVAYLGRNAPELLDLLFACARVGAILVPLRSRMPVPELEVVLQNTDPAAFVAEADYAETASEAASSLSLDVIPFATRASTARWRSSARRAPAGPRSRRRCRC